MKTLLLLCCIIALSSLGLGQNVLQGTVTDSTTNEKLIGINVFLEGTSLGGITDIEGNYRINNIPEGTYTVRVSCVGYESKKLVLTFSEDQNQSFHVRLYPAIIAGEEVVITAQMRGQLAAINQQLTSNAIVNVVSEERIKEMPDANAADAIGRLPGVSLIRSGGEASKVILRGLSDKFSVVTIDGNRMAPTDANERGVDLSTVSQGSLAGIELTKASTSDKDADAIAGSVNLVTKKAPSERLIRFEPKGLYNALDKSAGQYNFSGRYGERFFEDVFGLQVSGNIERIIRSNESTDFNYDTRLKSGEDFEITSFRPIYANEIRKRSGGSIILDVNTPDEGHILLNSMFNQTSRSYLTSYRTYSQTGQVIYDFRDRETDIKTFNSFLHGENHLFGIKADWNLAFSQAKRNDPLDYELNFTEPSIRDSTGKIISGMNNIPKEYAKGPGEKWVSYALNNFKVANIDHANDNAQSNFDKELSGSLNLSRQYSLSEDISGEIKLGGKIRQKTRYASFQQLRAIYYLYSWPIMWTKQADGTIVKKDLSGTRFDTPDLSRNGLVIFSNFLDPAPDNRSIYGKYALNPLINRDALRLWRQLNINGYIDQTGNDREYKENVEVEGNDYTVTERVLAGYAMNTLNIGSQISIVTGIRIESDDNDYSSKFTPNVLAGFPFPTGVLKDTTVFHTEQVILPNFHAILRPLDFITVRLAGYKMLARPDFNQRLLKFIASSATANNTLNVGNPSLKNAVAWNYEVQTQFYGNTIGLLSLSAFYKDIKNMYHSINGIQVSGQPILDSLGVPWKAPFPGTDSKFNLTFPYNSSKPTSVWGFEIEHQTDLKFLPGFLSNTILNYNFTIVRSETWVSSSKIVTDTVVQPPFPFPTPRTTTFLTEIKQKLEDQPEFFGNVSLGYDIADFSFRISAFHQGSYNTSFSSDQRSDGVQDAYTKLDIALKQGITENISVTLNINNITNAQEGSSVLNRLHSEWDLPNTNNQYGTSADLGIRIEL